MLTRRDFLGRSALLALSPTVPSFLAHTARAARAEKDARVLVVIQLDGGNDGINTVVPYGDDGYARNRKALRLPADELIKIDDHVALHPSMGDAAELLQDGRLSIVQGVGYPNPNRSHFRSMAIWHSARFDPEEHTGLGWLGRALDGTPRRNNDGPDAVFAGSGAVPLALRSRRSVASALVRPEDFTIDPAATGLWRGLPTVPQTSDGREAVAQQRSSSDPTPAGGLAAFVQRTTLDAYATSERLAELARARDGSTSYPGSELAERLELVARLIKAGFGTRVYYAVQGGYDTHAVQLRTHANLLRELARALKAFLDDMAAAGLADRVAVLVFSEFGRRVAENGSAGTDHGTAGPVLLAGPGVRGGLVGAAPSLTDLEQGDLKMSVDFRRVYASVLEQWLELPSQKALGGRFDALSLFRA